MARNLYLILLFTFFGLSSAYPHNKGAYVVTWTGDDEITQRDHGLLGRKMCTRGPAYWCYNITQAAECNAMRHCIKNVWEHPKDKLPEDNDSVCEVCLDMVKQARDQLLSNETQDELRQVLEGSCNLIPLKLVAKECRELADDFIPELVDALTSRMDPQMVCHISGLCNSVRIDEMLEEIKEIDGPSEVKPLDPENFDTCSKCEYYIGEAAEQLKRLTKKDLRVRLLDVCGYLGSYSESCKATVIHEMDAIYEFIQNNMNPKDVCSLIGLCKESSIHRVLLMGGVRQAASTNVRVWQPPQKNGDDLECDFCKQLTVSVRQWLVANATEEEFQQVLEGLCKQTGKYKKECLSLAEQYGKSLYDTLVNDLNPNEICQNIGVCNNSRLLRGQFNNNNAPVWTMLAMDKDSNAIDDDDDDDDSFQIMKLLPAERLTGDDEIKALPKSNSECQFCEYALHYLQNYLDDDHTEEEIKQKVDQLCDRYLPEEFADQCKTFVKEYGDALVTLLAQEVDPSQICPRLKLCTHKPQSSTAVGILPVKDILPTCALCTFTVEKLIGLIGKNMTKVQIDDAMEKVCDYMPKNIQDDCLSFMKNYGDQIAEMILISGTAHGVCAAIHLCILSPPPPTKIIMESQLPLDRYLPHIVTLDKINQMEKIEKDSVGCVMCEYVITTLDARLQDNATEEEIKNEVEHVCDYLPKTVKSKCQVLIDIYGEQIILYLSQEIDPAQLCTEIHLCKPEISTTNAVRDLQMDRCELCKLVSDYLSTILDDSQVDQKIDEVAENTCRLIPKSYSQECKAMIEDYGLYLINILAQETDKGKACAQIQLCPNATAATAGIDDNTVELLEY